MVNVSEVAKNIYQIDEQLYGIPQFGAVYFLDEERKALVDCGPTTSAQVVIDGIKKIGFRPENIDYLILTSIHLDHAGGAGFLLQNMPKAKVAVHYKGVPHLVNPAKLVSSVIEVQGEEAMARNGEVVAIPEERIQPIRDGDVIELSDKQILKFIDSPGHARRELSIAESRNGGVFVGDAVGNRIPGTEIMVPVTPAPSFDLEQYLNTLDRLMGLNATRLYFPHFGVTDDVRRTLESARKKLKERAALVDSAARENALDQASERIIDKTRIDLEPVREKMKTLYEYWTRATIPISANGFMKYYLEKQRNK